MKNRIELVCKNKNQFEDLVTMYWKTVFNMVFNIVFATHHDCTYPVFTSYDF